VAAGRFRQEAGRDEDGSGAAGVGLGVAMEVSALGELGGAEGDDEPHPATRNAADREREKARVARGMTADDTCARALEIPPSLLDLSSPPASHAV